MTEADIEIVLERAKEQYPDAKPRVNFAVLPVIERQNRTLGQVTQSGVHSPRHAAFARRCAGKRNPNRS